MKIIIMKIDTLIIKLILCTLFIFPAYCTLLGQLNDSISLKTKTHYKLLKIGLDGGVAYYNPKDVNSLIDNWLNSNGTVVRDKLITGIHLGFSVNGYLAVSPLKFFDIRPEISYNYIPKIFKYDYGSKALNISITSYSPGISVNFFLESWRLGGGLFKYYSQIKWKDYEKDFNDTWKGDNLGYHVYLGVNPKISSNFRMSITFMYRNIVIKELKNENSQVLKIPSEDRNFMLDLTGFEFRIGFYFSFIKIGGKHGK